MPVDDPDERSEVLIEALPYIQEFHDARIVLKFGGSIMRDDELKQAVAADIVLLQYIGIRPVIVHGGGPQIANTLERMGIGSQFVNGLRVTDAETMDVVEMVLAGRVNKDLVNEINQAGAHAIGLSGKDGQMLLARPHPHRDEVDLDLGQVGQITSVNPQPLELLEEQNYVPVVAPIAVDAEGTTYNMNADSVAGALAAGLDARKLIYLTDVPGVLEDEELVPSLDLDEADDYIDSGVIQSGMIPKVRSAVDAVRRGVTKAHIIDGTRHHSPLLELLTREGIGTQILDKDG